MIPTYQPKKNFLRQTLESILQQAPGADEMQIEVVDDCSPNVDVEAMVGAIGRGRVGFFRNPKNLGLAGAWNSCIGRACGEWVHLLHQDDYALPGFYQTLALAAERHPEVSLLATRCFFVDADGAIESVSRRFKSMENGTRAADELFYTAPFQCPGVVVRRSFYGTHGGFRPDLTYAVDMEMWARAVSGGGGLLTAEVLACYRQTDANETSRLMRTGQILHDFDRLNRLFAEKYPAFDKKKARDHQLARALQMAALVETKTNQAPIQAGRDYWRKNAPWPLRWRHFMGNIKRRLF